MTTSHHRPLRGFTITEILVVIGVIVVLSGFLLAALSAVRGSGEMAKSMNSLRQIGIWMQAYASDNREFILPSQFDYSNNPYKGKVRSGTVTIGNEFEGTWADILWTIHDLGGAEDPSGSVSSYRYDSPDAEFYARFIDFDSNPLRSGAENQRPTPGGSPGDLPTPFGPGAGSRRTWLLRRERLLRRPTGSIRSHGARRWPVVHHGTNRRSGPLHVFGGFVRWRDDCRRASSL